MFFPKRIKSISPEDLVLEIGPGGCPHPRADVFLEKRFDSAEVAEEQRGFAPALKTSKKVIFYDGERFPFTDKQFDYVICSHVLEHIENVDSFVQEIVRIGRKGYFEFPTVYHDYVYNIPGHISFIFHRDNVLYWIPKSESGLDKFANIQEFFYKAKRQGYQAMVGELRSFLVQGLEWEGSIATQRVSSLDLVTYKTEELYIPIKQKEVETVKGHLRRAMSISYHRVKNFIKSS